jgi:hypothetical protein
MISSCFVELLIKPCWEYDLLCSNCYSYKEFFHARHSYTEAAHCSLVTVYVSDVQHENK